MTTVPGRLEGVLLVVGSLVLAVLAGWAPLLWLLIAGLATIAMSGWVVPVLRSRLLAAAAVPPLAYLVWITADASPVRALCLAGGALLLGAAIAQPGGLSAVLLAAGLLAASFMLKLGHARSMAAEAYRPE